MDSSVAMAQHDASTTLSHFIIADKSLPSDSNELSILLNSIGMACKVISNSVRMAGIHKLYGLAGETNVQGEDVKKLDVLANDTFVNALKYSEKLSVMVSEENEEPIIVEDHQRGNYSVAFDPLDGSSNIDCNVSIGSIFGIYRNDNPTGTASDAMQPGSKLVAAGYSNYGSATQLVITLGNGVHVFTLDQSLGEFVLTHKNVKIPEKGTIYSINEGNSYLWDARTRNYVRKIKDPASVAKPYSCRYVGSMIADVHRTLLYGGIFMYPADTKNKNGKLRLLYECSPMAYIMEQAGGMAVVGTAQKILDIVPTGIHQRSPIVLGSPGNVIEYINTAEASE